MGSALVPPTTLEALQQNMRWDGFFHAAVWVVTLVGVYWLLNAARGGAPLPVPRRLLGLPVLGWGLFNLVEGIIDHHLLDLHHVRDLPAHVPLYDWLFLGIGGLGFRASKRVRAPLSAMTVMASPAMRTCSNTVTVISGRQLGPLQSSS